MTAGGQRTPARQPEEQRPLIWAALGRTGRCLSSWMQAVPGQGQRWVKVMGGMRMSGLRRTSQEAQSCPLLLSQVFSRGSRQMITYWHRRGTTAMLQQQLQPLQLQGQEMWELQAAWARPRWEAPSTMATACS